MKNRRNSATTARGEPESSSESDRIIYSLGSSTREKDQFIKLLKGFGIKMLADVRRFPVSRLEYFCKDKLRSLLESKNIGYVYLGQRLGGFREKGYQEYTQTEEFALGLDELKHSASKMNAVFMCAERFPGRCHRRFIARSLQKEGWRVIHIIDEGKTWEAKPGNPIRTKEKKNHSLSLPI